MWKANLCSTCKKGYMMLTGINLHEFRCNNPDCNQRLIDMTICETLEIDDKVGSEHYRDADGD